VATTAPRFAPGGPRDPSSFPGAFAYEHTDVPPGRTLAEYRRDLAATNRRRLRSRLPRAFRVEAAR
jgi:hypothetical protein